MNFKLDVQNLIIPFLLICSSEWMLLPTVVDHEGVEDWAHEEPG